MRSHPPAAPTRNLQPTRPPPGVDAAALAKLRDVVGDGIVEIVACFVADAAHRLDEIRFAASAGDPAAVCAAAHQLKATSASLGASRLSGLMQSIETAGARGSLDGVSELLDEAELDFSSVRELLSRLPA